VRTVGPRTTPPSRRLRAGPRPSRCCTSRTRTRSDVAQGACRRDRARLTWCDPMSPKSSRRPQQQGDKRGATRQGLRAFRRAVRSRGDQQGRRTPASGVGGRGATAPPVGVHACTTRRWDLRRLREASRGAQSGHSRLEGRVRRAFLGERQAASLTLQERSTDGAGFLTGVRGTCGWAGRR